MRLPTVWRGVLAVTLSVAFTGRSPPIADYRSCESSPHRREATSIYSSTCIAMVFWASDGDPAWSTR